MPVPDSGELELRGDINNEVNDNTTDNNVSLKTLSDDAGFDSAPYAMSEFYDYTSFITPTVTQATTGSVFDTSMVLNGSMQSPSGGNQQYGWYFGTDSTMTNNTFIHDGNTNGSTSTINFDYTKGSLSGGTTYYIWTAVRDTSGNVLASAAVKTQATLAAVSYSTGYGGSQNLNGSEHAGAGNNSCNGVIAGSVSSSYNHVYHGWSGLSGGYSASDTHSGAAAWETYDSAPNVTIYWAWRTDGTAVENRSNEYVSISGCLTGYGSDSKANHNWYSVPNSGNRTLTNLSFTGSGYTENWPAVNNTYTSGGWLKRSNSAGSNYCYAHTNL